MAEVAPSGPAWRRRLRRLDLPVFLALAVLVTWSVWVPRALGLGVGVVGPLWTWAPALTALACAAAIWGRVGLRDLGSRLVRWRVAWWWYAVVLLGPVAFAFAAAAVGVLLARPWATVEPRMLTGGWPDVLIFLLVLVITDGLGEEIAWRGYALPRMLARFSPALASLGLGAFWWFWHLPLLLGRGAPLTGTPVWLLLGDLLAMSVIVTAVFLHTRGSVLLAVLLHASTNLAAVSPRVGPEGDLLLPLVVLSMKVVLAAVILAAPGALPDPRGSDSEATFPPAEPRER